MACCMQTLYSTQAQPHRCYGRKIHIHRADETRIEGDGLELHHHETAQFQMVEEQIQVEVVARKFEMDLPVDEGEAGAEFQQKALNVVYEGLFDFPLPTRIGRAEKVKQVGVLENLGGHIRFGRRQGGAKVGNRFPLALMETSLDLEAENRLRPTLRNRFVGIPLTYRRIIQLVQESDIAPPGNLCNDPLHKFQVRPGHSKRPHVLKVARRETAHFRVCFAQIGGKTVDNLGPPAFLFLPLQNQPPNIPIQEHHGRIGGHDSPQTLY